MTPRFTPDEVPESLQGGAIARALATVQHLSLNPAGADEHDAHAAIIQASATLKRTHAETLDALTDYYQARRSLVLAETVAAVMTQRAELADAEARRREQSGSLTAADVRHHATLARYLADRAEYDRRTAEYRACRADDDAERVTKPPAH